MTHVPFWPQLLQFKCSALHSSYKAQSRDSGAKTPGRGSVAIMPMSNRLYRVISYSSNSTVIELSTVGLMGPC